MDRTVRILVVLASAEQANDVCDAIRQGAPVCLLNEVDAHLTEREKEVLGHVVAGLSNREIGERLGITESTVKRHLHSILEKLHMENRVQAATYAMRAGLVAAGH